MEFIKEVATKQSQKEKKMEAKQEFVKVALKQKAKRDRLVKKMEKAGELYINVKLKIELKNNLIEKERKK